MDNRTNTIAGWVLAACGAALGLSILGGMVIHSEKPEKPGYPLAGGTESAEADAGAADVPIATLLAKADPAKGAEVFKQCAACHTATQGGANGIGPNLYATVGEAIAQGKAGYAFSDALKAHTGKWDFDTLNDWLKSPRKFANGTKMTFAGLSKAEDRANVMVYLNSLGSNLPLPAAPAAAAPVAAAPATGNAAAPETGNAATPATANAAAPAAAEPAKK
jgi:cytochrome c